MKRKKIVAWILILGLIIQSPSTPLIMGTQTEVKAAEIVQTDEGAEASSTQSETEVDQLQSETEQNQIEVETEQNQTEEEAEQIQTGAETEQKEIQSEQETNQLQIEEETESVTPTPEPEESASTNYPFQLSDLTTTNSKSVLTVTIRDAADFIKLSHCDPQTIQNANLDIQISGSVTLTEATVEQNGVVYSFAGIGSKDYPFAGALTGQSITIKTDQPLFRAVMSSVNFYNNTIQWEGKVGENEQGHVQKPVFAEYYQFASVETYDLSLITIQAKSDDNVVMGPLIGEICGANGTLSIGNTIKYTGATAEVYSSAAGQNAGLICNTLSSGKVIITDGFAAPASYSVKALDGHAGGIIGEMKSGTELTLYESVVGATINGKKDVGGVVGHVENAFIKGSGSVGAVFVTAQEGSAGGIAGYLQYDNQINSSNNSIELNSLKVENPSLSSSVAIGGLYGTLNLSSQLRAKLILSDGITLCKGAENECPNYGGLIGSLIGSVDVNGDVAILEIDGNNKTITSDGGKNNTYQGGVFGCIGAEDAPATVFIKDISVKESNPKGALTAFGGLSGKIEDKSIAALDGTIEVKVENNIERGGGLIGEMQPGSVLSLSGTTNLKDSSFTASETVGQLVGSQDCALVFANGSGTDSGWSYIRSSQKAKIDDIGSYGQVIRLKCNADSTASKLSSDLFSVCKPNESSAGKLVMKAYEGTGYAIANEDDFALLSVLWQSHGIIKADKTPEYAGLSNASISLSANIDLTGSGITGLTRDVKETESVFHGSFNGANKSITLAIGEAYGYFANDSGNVPATDGDDGCGRIYRHNALGLFASADGSISNLTIKGKIDVESYADQCYVGGAAGLIEGGTFTLSGVTASEMILCGNDTKKAVYAGGLYGAVSNTSNITFGGDGDGTAVTSSAAIQVKDVHGGKYMCLGGLIGAIVGSTNESNITMQNVLLQGPSQQGIQLNLDGTSITDGQSFFAGGLIGAIVPYTSGKKKTLNIEQVTIDGYMMESNNTSGDNSISGGLLGSLWTSTDVTFGKAGSTGDSFALRVVDGSNTADNVTYFGGLVYAASGKWTVMDHGIDLSGAKLSAKAAKSFGILVHDAYDGGTPILGTTINRGGLYIELTSHWDNAYRLEVGEQKITTTVNSSASFDEFAAYTAGSDIWLSEKNGVISLHTDDSSNDGKLLMNGTNINSYVNRSEVGQTKKTNSHSRYYYNLDRFYAEVKTTNNTNSRIDTNEELMLWSVCRYSATNLRNYFTVGDVSYTASKIGGESATSIATFDLNGYSYYPIDLLNMDLTVQNAEFTFYNQEIENGEKRNSNKNTSTATQHEGMHCGLFRNYLRQSSSSTTTRSYELTAKNLSFSGTIGTLENKSGALLCGKVEGNTTNGSNIYTVAASDILLNGLQVREMLQDNKPEYAPLLIAEPSSYSTTSVSRVSTGGYTTNKKVATSLIGKAGSSTATQVNLSFSEMNLPSENGNTIFTHASFLESFQYMENGVGTAVYNFTKADQDNNLVTFGAEIDNTKEYVREQLWYYDESGYGTDDNLVTVGEIKASKDEAVSNFYNKYLPYVYQSYPSGTDGKKSNCHEIEINHRIVDILTGCGTYADPYVITDKMELESIASFLQSGAPRKNWRVTISADQESICSRRKNNSALQDTVYICDGTNWKIDMENPPSGAKEQLDNNTILYYLLSAYYDIQDNLELQDFIGLGSKDYGFRGVVTSTNSKSITLKGSNTSHGLIPYSYGAVVKDLTIKYQKDEGKGLVITSSTKDAFAPSAFFGGVIGVILGGDNIIDNVSVTMEDGFLSLTGDKAYLIQVGGYVGSICGGGVIFRNMDRKSGMSDNWFGNTGSWTPSTAGDAYKSLYVNPFVGRVLDGFAFSESCTVNNTDKNYKINDIDTADRNVDGTLISNGSITGGPMLGNGSGGSILTIKNAVGLLAFSAILNSGASAGPASDLRGTSAYAGGTVTYDENYQFGNARFGKVRCAAYDHIGDPTAKEDFEVANRDDRVAPGLQKNGGNDIVKNLNDNNADVNLCYLAARFGDKYAMFAAVAYVSDVRYVFKNEIYDMTAYGNGYQGIGCRYKVNAGNNLAADDANYDRVVPWIRYVQGNCATIKASINVREYADDDFWTMGVGAVFGYTYFYNNSSLSENNSNAVSDMTISDSTLSLKYYRGDGKENTSGYSARKAGVGGFSGAQIGGNSIGTVKNVQIKNTTIEGGYHAGGMFGSIGRVGFSSTATGEHFVYPYNAYSTANFIDCGYQNLDVKGYFYSGGFVGEFYSKTGAENVIQGATSSLVESAEEQGQSNTQSTIQSVGNDVYDNESKHQFSAGGLVGHYISNSNGNLTIEGSSTNSSNIMKDVNLYAYGKAAGLIGWIQNTKLIVKDTTVMSTVKNSTSITSNSTYEGTVNYSVVGGIIGRSQDCKVLLSSCYVTNMKIGNGKETAAGGLVGDSVVGTTELETFNCGVENCQIQTGAVTGKSCYAGGLIGFLGSTWTGSNVLLTGSKVTDSTASGGTAYKGLLVGRMLDSPLSYATQFSGARVAGISVQKLSTDQLKLKEIGNQDSTLLGKCYFAYADYEEVPVEPASALLDATAVWPYVVTSPVSQLQVQKNGNSYYLSGDGASWTEQSSGSQEKFLPRAKTILEESKKAEAEKFKYTRTGLDLVGFDFSQRFSTYWENQGIILSEGMSAADLPTDFPVLQISGGNTGVITDYLNLLTNGGYSRACELASGNVSAKTERYKWNDELKVFEYSSEKASLRANADHTFSVTREYDNGMNQFTLLTVTFTERSSIDATQSYSYKVQIPLIVRRVLEIDFTATLSYGANLNASAYDQVEHHVLDSFGNTISGYLTYSYNSAYGEYSEYGWQNFIDEGGDVAQRMEKTLVFKQQNAFPSGTQLTLIDEASGTVYYKTIEDGAKEILMSDFKAEDGTPYQSRTIGEIMKVTAAESSDGTFIQVDEDGKPIGTTDDAGPYEKASAFVDGAYYRLAKADGTEKDYTKYKLTVIGNYMPTENYYLIITIPEGDAALVNGQLETQLGGTIPHHINYKLRGKNEEDTHTNTASTYLISKGYQQTLEETLNSSLGVSQIIDGANRTLHVAVQSKITFPMDQVYQEYDALYQSFTANLQTVINTKTDAVKFPSQTAGTVYFYVTDGNGGYYSNLSNWENPSQNRERIASYTWTSDGESMELLLSADGTMESMIDLQGMRDAMKTSGQDYFYVEAVLEAVIPAAGLDVIPESDSADGLPENYAKLTYVSHLSTQKESLSYSSMKAVKTDTKISYYRKINQENRFTYDADQIDQLGINLKDLQEEYLNEAGTCSRIETTARYNLSGVPNLEDILRQSAGVRYTLNLRARGTEQSDVDYPQNHLSDGNAYIQLDPKVADYRYQNDGTWSWTVGKDQYMNGDEVKIGSVFDGTSFVERIPIWVRVDNVESESFKHFYANYKLELRVEVIDSEGNILIGSDSDYLIYTLTKIQPTFVDDETVVSP